MSSASSGRYQSRLFNFVHQQYRGLGDRLHHSFRHLHVATTWSLEALLSPVYMLFQKAFESAGRQLHPEEEQRKPQLQAHEMESQIERSPCADNPIQRVLEAVEKQPADVLKRNLSVVRGIASELVSRNLVLVSNENEILDILTLQQQEKLQDKIITEVANYWRYWRLIEENDERKLLTEIERLLTKLTSDSGIVDQMPALPTETRVAALVEPTCSLNPYPAVVLLDAAVAKLELNALVPMQSAKLAVQKRRSELIEVVQTQLNIFLYGKEQLTTSAPGAIAAENWHSSALKIQALIGAAIDFFFGDRTAKKVKQSTSAKSIAEKLPGKRLPQRPPTLGRSNSQELLNVELADPWLRLNDLFDDSQQIRSQEETFRRNFCTGVSSYSPPTRPASPALVSSPSARYSLKNLINSYQKFFLQPKSGAALAQQRKPTRDLAPNQKTFAFLASAKRTASSISQLESKSNKGEISQQQSYQTTEVEAKPDWIETKAKTVGYEKHPLEQILEWLDGVLLWLEEIFVKMFQSLRRLWQGSRN